MQKHPKIIASTTGPCTFKSQALVKPIELSKRAYQRYLKPANFHFVAGPGIHVYGLPCGCSVWCFSTGGRYLTGAPYWPNTIQ